MKPCSRSSLSRPRTMRGCKGHADQLVCWHMKSIQTSAPVTVIERVELVRLACVFDAQMDQIVAGQAREQGEAPPAHRTRDQHPQPFVADVASVQAERLAPGDEPEHEIGQAEGQHEARPALPALLIPSAPEQNGSDQPEPHDRSVEPQIPRLVGDPPHLVEAEYPQQIDDGSDRGHEQGRPDSSRTRTGKADRFCELVLVRCRT